MDRRLVAQELKIVFCRPPLIIVQEPVVLSTSFYLALIYSILYLFFQGYPIIFHRRSTSYFIYLSKRSRTSAKIQLFLGVYSLPPSLISLGYIPSKSRRLHVLKVGKLLTYPSNFQS